MFTRKWFMRFFFNVFSYNFGIVTSTPGLCYSSPQMLMGKNQKLSCALIIELVI